jgi:alpha-L-fucosidase
METENRSKAEKAVCDLLSAFSIKTKPGMEETPSRVVKMLEEVGNWMAINGEAVYGSKAWTTLGEGEIIKGKLKSQPGGKLGKWHAEFPFNAQDIRFTEGKNGSIYAFCMSAPEAGQSLRILSMGKKAGHISEVKEVTLLGFDGQLEWKQTDEALEIVCPQEIPSPISVVFRIN